jgi:adenosylhomocysteine nucleosidase
LNTPTSPYFVVLISANSEWRFALDILKPDQVLPSPLGDNFLASIQDDDVVFFHSGWGKTRSAAATQYVIDHWQPKLVINLGTCGGLEGHAVLGETLLVTDTVMYDVYERMGDSHRAIDFYRAKLDTEWIGSLLPQNTRRSPLASADQDIDFQNFSVLTKDFDVPAADWESAAIAWVLNANRVNGLILRGVSDIITRTGSETDNNHALWHMRAKGVIQKLFNDLPFYLKKFSTL